MKKINLLSQLLIVCISLISVTFAQKVTGKITDASTGNGISSATIIVKGSKTGTSSSANGNFNITAKAGDVLVVSATGYATLEATATDTNNDIALQPKATDLTDVVVIGTRGIARAKTETAVPIDVIKINQVGAPTAKMELTSVLNMAAPSFNYNKQSGSDGADHVDLGTLRGLGPDQTLVLINGKRRHTTALVGLFGTRGKGSTGTDLNSFPQAAVDRIEILRDGASAQYGSDAIAGVINIILKKDINHWNINAGWAGYYDTKFNAAKFNKGNQYVSAGKIDGQQFSFNATNGFALGNNGGFASFALSALTQGKTYRQVDTTNWKTDKNSLRSINTSRRANGDGSVKTYGASYNMELPIKNTRSTFYSFATVNTRESDAFAYSRNFSENPQRFPVTTGGALVFVPSIMQVANDGETYYNPHIGTNINDAAVALGIKGKSVHDWNWDASVTTGKNDFQFNGSNTFNASDIGNITKNNFDDGGFRFRQTTVNVDFSKSFKTVASGLNIGYGFEYRSEKYKINQGEEKSWNGYYSNTIDFPNLDTAGGNNFRALASGSQGFPGFSPSDVVNATRENFSAYLDAEINITKAWLVDAAIRGEKYSDFGKVLTYKLATRIKATDNFNIRGSFSTGFRAPSLQQINFSSTLTNFSGGNLVQSRYARNGDALANAAGIPKLKEETSTNASLGFAWKPLKGLTVTIDGYLVKVKDRVVLTGSFLSYDNTLPTEFVAQLNSLNVSDARFLANAASTTNTGIDVVADYTKKWNNKTLKLLLAGNLQKITVDKINVPTELGGNKYISQKTFFSDREESLLKASAPASKINLSAQYNCKKIGVGMTLTSFGAIKILGFGDGSIGTDNPNYAGINPQVYDDLGNVIPDVANYQTKISTDIFISYKLFKNASIFVGMDNAFNIHPDFTQNPLAKKASVYNETGGPWDSVQMGYNGRKLFTRLVFDF